MPDEQTQQEREAALLAAFLRLRSHTAEALRALVASLVAGALTAAAFGEQALLILEDAHAQAGYLGRQLAGVLDPFGEDDTAFGAAQAAAEGEFLKGFVADLENGRYLDAEGVLSEKAVASRAAMYAYSLLGSVNEVWGMSFPETTLFYWHLGSEDPCPECPERELNSPYTLDTIPGWPGDGSTTCLFNCHCVVTTGSGYKSLDLSGGGE